MIYGIEGNKNVYILVVKLILKISNLLNSLFIYLMVLDSSGNPFLKHLCSPKNLYFPTVSGDDKKLHSVVQLTPVSDSPTTRFCVIMPHKVV